MFWKKARRSSWPEMPFEEVKKRARLLVIDDSIFTYLDLFKRDGYAIEQWTDVEDLGKLEQGFFDLILLDVQGVGKSFSPSDQGLGVLRHLRQVAPAQVVIAFSNADFSLKYQDFFRLADATLPKSADYLDFRKKVDELLRDRFSMGFFVSRIMKATEIGLADRVRAQHEAEDAILEGQPEKLRRGFLEKMANKENIDRVITIAKIGTEVMERWQK